jgi:hypothetical protein
MAAMFVWLPCSYQASLPGLNLTVVKARLLLLMFLYNRLPRGYRAGYRNRVVTARLNCLYNWLQNTFFSVSFNFFHFYDVKRKVKLNL